MPFSEERLFAALGSGERIDNRNHSAVREVEIGGKHYIVKQIEATGRFTPEMQARNEAAASRALKAMGHQDLAVHHAWSVRGPDGKVYSVQSKEEGRATNWEERAVPSALNTREAFVTAYVLGLQDRNRGNILIGNDGNIKLIDNSFAFRQDKQLANPYNNDLAVMLSRARPRSGNRSENGYDGPAISRSYLRQLASRESAVLRALAPYHLSDREISALRQRFAVIRSLSKKGPLSRGDAISINQLYRAAGMARGDEHQIK